jgi:hypothetical protein
VTTTCFDSSPRTQRGIPNTGAGISTSVIICQGRSGIKVRHALHFSSLVYRSLMRTIRHPRHECGQPGDRRLQKVAHRARNQRREASKMVWW